MIRVSCNCSTLILAQYMTYEKNIIFFRCDQDTKPVAPVLGEDAHLENRAKEISKKLEKVVTNDQDLLQARLHGF